MFVVARAGRRRREWRWSGWGRGSSTNAWLENAFVDGLVENILLKTAIVEGIVKGGTGRSTVSVGAAHAATHFFEHVPFALSARSGRRGWTRIIHLGTICFIVDS